MYLDSGVPRVPAVDITSERVLGKVTICESFDNGDSLYADPIVGRECIKDQVYVLLISEFHADSRKSVVDSRYNHSCCPDPHRVRSASHRATHEVDTVSSSPLALIVASQGKSINVTELDG